MPQKILRLKFILLSLIGIALVSIINLSILYLVLPGPNKNTTTLIVKKNLTTWQLVDVLSQNKIIKYPKLFYIFAKIYSAKDTLKSGEYQFTTKISPAQVLSILISGKSIIHRIVIPEGLTVSEILAKINGEERLLGEVKGDISEGFLMPSTYFYSYGDQKEHIIDQMRTLMSRNLDKVMERLSPKSPLKSRLEVLTLASIVEKETNIDQEKPIIAAAFLNRLKKGMKLQADPTVTYALTKGQFKLDKPLTKKDLQIESPYNTYYTPKLPPGPISCPGLKALESVVNPANVRTLYFVANGTGGHNFANTLEEHNANVARYKKQLIKNAKATD